MKTSNPQTTKPTPTIVEKWKRIYSNPLSMTMGEFVMIMQFAKERLQDMGEKFDVLF